MSMDEVLKVKIKMSVARRRDLSCFVLIQTFAPLIFFSGNPVVDYLSLDVEGAEISVLRTIPWQRVKIRYYIRKRHQKRRFRKKPSLIYRTASIEVAHSDTAAIVAHMVKAGFRVIR